MPKIVEMRPVLLSAPYGNNDSLEVLHHLPTGYRNCGLIELTLDDGTTGLGEAYLAVFAPGVFAEMVHVLRPYVLGGEVTDMNAVLHRIHSVVGYWGRTGPAMHVLGALETAMVDARAEVLNVPAHTLFGGTIPQEMTLYGSGGDSTGPEAMQAEMDLLSGLGIGLFKIRARNFEAAKTAWVLENAAARNIKVAVDMCQNLSNPSQSVSDILLYLDEVKRLTRHKIVFLEEALGPLNTADYALLRQKTAIQICGGETLTASEELCRRIQEGLYDFVQPDATVIGGMGEVLKVFDCAYRYGRDVVVHAWSGAVGMMANYHAAFAGGARLAEWPMPDFALRRELLVEPLKINQGKIEAPRLPGLGVKLTGDIERKYPFREDAAYRCIPVEYHWPRPEIWT